MKTVECDLGPERAVGRRRDHFAMFSDTEIWKGGIHPAIKSRQGHCPMLRGDSRSPLPSTTPRPRRARQSSMHWRAEFVILD